MAANQWWTRKKEDLDLAAAEANAPSPLQRAAAVLDAQADERAEAINRANAGRRLDILAKLAKGNDYSPEMILEQAKVSSSPRRSSWRPS